MSILTKIFRGKFIGTVNGHINWTDTKTTNHFSYLLFEHPVWGRNFKAVGFPFSHLKKETKLFASQVAPWLAGGSLPKNLENK